MLIKIITIREIVARWLGQLELLVSPQCHYLVSYNFKDGIRNLTGFGQIAITSKKQIAEKDIEQTLKVIHDSLKEKENIDAVIVILNLVRIAVPNGLS